MPKTQPPEKPQDAKQEKCEMRNALIGEQVLHALGQPGNLLMIQVRPLWENHYRVNVVVGVDVTSARVAESYFLVADGDGQITASTPLLTRRYAE